MKKITYGIAFIGLIVSGCIYLHLAAKYIFVRILRNSKHLQPNNFVHWATWLAAVWGLAALGFVFSEGIPVFSWMGAISGAVCFSPLSIILPSYCWIYDHGEYRTGTMDQKVFYWFHWLLFTRLVCLCALVGFMPSPTRFILHTPQAPVMVSLMNFSLTILQHAFLTGRRISPNIMLMV
jgi:hypothetical protein